MDSVKSLESENDGKTYTVPETCIGNAQDARDTIASLVKSENTRSKRRAKFNGMLNGNPPWPGLLREKGQGERANFTLREAEGFIAAAKTPYYALMFKNERFITLTLDYGGADTSRLMEWAGKIATRYQYANEDDDSLDMHAQRSQFQMVAHGSGPLAWEDDKDWFVKSRMAGQILLPDDASADIDEWDTAACPRSYLPTDLWNKVKKLGDDNKTGWNVPAVKRAIMHAAQESVQNQLGMEWERYESEMRKGATGWNAKSKRILVYDLLQREFTGKISHFMVLQEDAPSGSQVPVTEEKDKDPMKGFLYRKIGRYEEWSQTICPFLYDVGPDGQWHSVKGAGPKIFDYCSVSDRLTCRMLDGAMKASGIIVKATTATALNESAFTDVSGGTVVGPGYDAQDKRIAPDLQSPLLAKRDLQNHLQSNTGQYKQRVSDENQEPTLGQAQLNVQQQNVLGEGDADRYCKYLDRFHRERFRRILLMGERLHTDKNRKLAPDERSDAEKRNLTKSERLALRFYSGCIEDGVPPEILKFENFCRIKATRLVGNGSRQMRQMIVKEILPLSGGMDERGRNFTMRAAVSAFADESWADATFPRYDTPQVVDSHMSLAQLENNFLRTGGRVLVDPSQDNVVHFDSHLKDIGLHAEEVQGGQGDPKQLLLHLKTADPHMGEHLKPLAQDPLRKDQFKQMQEAWLGVSKMSDQLSQQVQEAEEAAAKNAPDQQQDPAMVAAIMKTVGELAIKRQKMEGDHQLKAEKQRFVLQQSDIKSAHGIKIENFKAVNEANTQARKAETEKAAA